MPSANSLYENISQKNRWPMLVVLLNTLVINVLTFISPVYMAQIYDRILPSRGVESLVAISVLAITLYACSGFFEYSRMAVLKRIANSMERIVKVRSLSAILNSAKASPKLTEYLLRDLTQLKKFIGSNALVSILDAVFIPLFVLSVFYIHWILGWICTLALLGLVLIVLFEYKVSTKHKKAKKAELPSQKLDDAVVSDTGVILSLGMSSNISSRIVNETDKSNNIRLIEDDHVEYYVNLSKTIKNISKTLVLAVAVILAMQEQISSGLMIVVSILVSRALSPFTKLVSIRQKFEVAIFAYKHLQECLYNQKEVGAGTFSAPLRGRLELKNITVAHPGGQGVIVRALSFAASPGDVISITGPAGSGKSSLMKVITGAAKEKAGAVLYDNTPVWNWDFDYLGGNIGYVPQFIHILPGTIKENIARFSDIDMGVVVKAARLAGVHDYICSLNFGYDTHISKDIYLSPSIVKKLGLARAFYGSPRYYFFDCVESDLNNHDKSQFVEAIAVLSKEKSTIVLAGEQKLFGVSERLAISLPSGKAVTSPRSGLLIDPKSEAY